MRIIPDEENNLLVVVAPPHEWNIISRILKQLDIMPRQVLNEVLIAEVRLTDDLKYGIEFLLGGVPSAPKPPPAPNGLQPHGLLVAVNNQRLPLLRSFRQTGTTPPPRHHLRGGHSIRGLGDLHRRRGVDLCGHGYGQQTQGLINLLAAEGKVEILASPQIMAANNQEARIQIGSDVPTLTSQSAPLISQTTSFQTSTVQYRSTGIILSVKPQINAKGLVTLDIAQEVSNANTTTTGVRQPHLYGAQRQDFPHHRGQPDRGPGRAHPGGPHPHPGRDSRFAEDALPGALVRLRRDKQTEDRTFGLDYPAHHY